MTFRSASFDSPAVADRVASLRELAAVDPLAAQDAVWAWFERLGTQLPEAAAADELAELFRNSAPGDAIDGQSEGLLLGWVQPDPKAERAGRVLRLLAQQLTSHATPWLGKRFVREDKRGTNSVTRLAVAVKLIAPTYRLRKAGGHYEGFEMRNWVEPSTLDADTQVLVIDYQQDNPWPMTRIRDELVEIVPSTYLGKMIYCQKAGNTLWAYFVLKTPVEA